MIYVAQILKGKWVKIGFSEEPSCAGRIAQLQTGNPYRIEIAFTVEGTLRQEQAVHSALRVAFGRVRIRTLGNEWYPGLGGFMQKALAALRYGPNNGIAFLDTFNPAVRQPGKERLRDTHPRGSGPVATTGYGPLRSAGIVRKNKPQQLEFLVKN